MRYTLTYTFVLVWLAGLAVGGFGPLALFPVAFGGVPLADAVVGEDPRPPGGRRALHDGLLRAWVPVQLGCITLAVALAPHLTLAEAVAAALALGILTGAGGITIAHELLHRRSALDRGLAEVLMASVSYTWFVVEHVHGHHKWVGTPRDPATAAVGTTVWGFVPRSVLGGLRSFLAIEAGKPLGRRLRFAAGIALAWALAATIGGLPGLLVFGVQAAGAVTLLEMINYIEHYGLVRERTAAGGYGPVLARHSWNADHAVSGAFLFELPRHADHHAHAAKAFDELVSDPDAPRLPYGYATMLLVAAIPPLWFALMDRRVAAVSPQPA